MATSDRIESVGLSSGDPAMLVEVDSVSVEYHTRRGALAHRRVAIQAVTDVDLTIERGQSLGLVGATGSGKSTIAKVIMGMVAPTNGAVRIDGKDLGETRGAERAALRRRVQVALQDPYASLDPRMKVSEIVAEPLTLGRPVFDRSRRKRISDRVDEVLHLVGIPTSKRESFPHQFSGGQRQRIAIARALAPEPDLIVLDEPTSALDVSVRAQILNLLKSLQAELGVTFVVISHDLVTVAYLASHVAVMHLGRVVEMGRTRDLYRAPRHPYTLELLASAPAADRNFLRETTTSALSQDVLPATACPYAPRCALRVDLGEPERCLTEAPELVGDTSSHRARCHFSDEVVARAGILTEGEADGTSPR